MSVPPAYQPLWDELLAFVTRAEHTPDLVAGRQEYVRHTGEAFAEDRSFEPRMRAFLDWYIFDRPMGSQALPPVRGYPVQARLDEARTNRFQLLSRTVHGIFELRGVHGGDVDVRNLLTGAQYAVPAPEQIESLARAELFEARLVPFEGRYRFSSAFIFHPDIIRSPLLDEIARLRRERSAEPVQELIFTLSRMAVRAEHYRNIRIELIYDFVRPPPKVGGAVLRFDRDSVSKRLGRRIETPVATPLFPGLLDAEDPASGTTTPAGDG